MKKGLTLIAVLVLVSSFFVFFNGTEKEEAVSGAEESKEEINQWTWETPKGTFVLSERIAKKVARGEKLIIRVSSYVPSSPYFVSLDNALKAEAKKYGVDYKMIGPADGVGEKQVAELETILGAEQIDGLAIGTYDIGSTKPMFELAWKKGIPTIAVDLDSPGTHKLTYVGPPAYEVIGAKAAEGFMKIYPEKKAGKLALFGAFPEAPYGIGELKGFLDTLEENGYQLETIGPFRLGLDKAVGYGVVENAFLANPDITAIFVHDEYVVVAAEYLKRNNLQGKIKLIGCNDMLDICQYIKGGIIQQSTSLETFPQGEGIMKVLYEFITEGKTVQDPYNTPLENITMSNVDEYIELNTQ